ncbi:hypothetical protein T484DRAFT_1811948 [Baffinella frigidus]|nr:hypothetical protein T484DRAFT_1811948 [Cryptophyta sp. CCMP2293]
MADHAACEGGEAVGGARRRGETPDSCGVWAANKRRLRGAVFSALAVGLICFCALTEGDGGGRVALASTGEMEYSVAQASAKLMADKVEVKNSQKRLAKMKGWLDSSSGRSDAALGARAAASSAATTLRAVLLTRASQADAIAQRATEATAAADLTGLALTPEERREAVVQAGEEAVFAGALRKAADRAAGAKAVEGSEMDQYLSQYQSKFQLREGLAKEGRELAKEEGSYQSKFQLRVGLAKEGRKLAKEEGSEGRELAKEEGSVRDDRLALKSKVEKKKAAPPTDLDTRLVLALKSKVEKKAAAPPPTSTLDSAEREAMAIERLETDNADKRSAEREAMAIERLETDNADKRSAEREAMAIERLETDNADKDILSHTDHNAGTDTSTTDTTTDTTHGHDTHDQTGLAAPSGTLSLASAPGRGGGGGAPPTWVSGTGSG